MTYREECTRRFPKIQPQLLRTYIETLCGRQVLIKVYDTSHKARVSKRERTNIPENFQIAGFATGGLSDITREQGDHIVTQAEAAKVFAPPQDWGFND